MAADKRLETLQEEIKLLKGELKHSLASVRDYLLNQELPSAELMSLADGAQKITLDTASNAAASALGNDMMSGLPGAAVDEEDMPPEDEELISVEPQLQEEEETTSEEPDMGQGMVTDIPEDTLVSTEEDVPERRRGEARYEPTLEEPREEGEPMEYARTEDAGPAPPRVNMLANLITWVARAKKDIGYEQLPVFLEVYGLSGHLSPELKEVILHFAEITGERPEAPGDAETWSQAMLTLHGILTGGDAPLHPAIPSWSSREMTPAAEPAAEEDELIEVDRPAVPPVKLKLVFPDGEKSREFCIDLTPESDNGGPGQHRKK
jgi:hypothetical protein